MSLTVDRTDLGDVAHKCEATGNVNHIDVKVFYANEGYYVGYECADCDIHVHLLGVFATAADAKSMWNDATLAPTALDANGDYEYEEI
jgi:hypothetical protein